MNPAFSVVFLTTLIGAGQGLFLALLAIERAGAQGEPLASATFLAVGGAVALGFTALGLVASFFHLGRPERAWRAASKWRTSWLSREVIALPVFMGFLLAWSLLVAAGAPAGVVGALAALACLALYVCTAMVYASLRFLQEWASPYTMLNYLLLGLASGTTLATALAAFGAPALAPALAVAAMAFTALAAVNRTLSLRRNAQLRPRSTLQTAIGIRHPRIRQRAMGFMGGSFNTREFFHGKAAGTLRSVKWGFLVGAFALPLLLLAGGWVTGSAALLGLAFAVQYLGLLAERWFFLAQANHPQNLYYQAVS